MREWRIDPEHSVVAFSVRHMMVSHIHGLFTQVSGLVKFDHEDPSSISAELEIDATSLSTGVARRDEHLRGPDFFDAANHPRILFRTTGAIISHLTGLRVTGDLTLRGVTRHVVLETTWYGPVESMEGQMIMAFSGRTSIEREEFGMTWNQPLRRGGVMVGRTVELDVDLEAILVRT